MTTKGHEDVSKRFPNSTCPLFRLPCCSISKREKLCHELLTEDARTEQFPMPIQKLDRTHLDHLYHTLHYTNSCSTRIVQFFGSYSQTRLNSYVLQNGSSSISRDLEKRGNSSLLGSWYSKSNMNVVYISVISDLNISDDQIFG